MAQQVDIFIPVDPQTAVLQQHAARRKPQKAEEAEPQVRIVGNDVIAPGKKIPLAHLRPRYVVQRAQPAPPALVIVEPKKPVTVRPSASAAMQPVAPPLIKPVPKPAPVARPYASVPDAAPAKLVRKRNWRKLLLPACVISILLVAGAVPQAAAAGEAFVGAYAIFALWRRIDSRRTFMLALASLGCILLMLLVRPDPLLMKNFAIYTFLFMLVGTLSLAVESRY